MVFLQKIHKKCTSVAFTCFCFWEIATKINYVRRENELRKYFCRIKNKQPHCLRISAHQLTS